MTFIEIDRQTLENGRLTVIQSQATVPGGILLRHLALYKNFNNTVSISADTCFFPNEPIKEPVLKSKKEPAKG